MVTEIPQWSGLSLDGVLSFPVAAQEALSTYISRLAKAPSDTLAAAVWHSDQLGSRKANEARARTSFDDQGVLSPL